MGAPEDEQPALASSLALQDRIEALLARHRGVPTSPSQQEINDLYTDGCAAVLALETERLRVKRRMTAAAIDSAGDADAAREASSLAMRGDELVDELARLKQLVKQLRAAVDWAQDEEPAAPPRRRFRRL
jgi:ABC-type phosphate transport system auxiliary subunit